MKILLHDTFATAEMVEPVRMQWIEPGFPLEVCPELSAAEIGGEDFALAPAPECTLLVHTHQVVPSVGVVTSQGGAIAIRSPVRPDELIEARVVLYETSSTAEVLARALLWPFFGITTGGWSHEPVADADLTIIEGALALEPPEAGFQEDLARAWYVLTGMGLVSHVLLAPVAASDDVVERVASFLARSAAVAKQRRRELRKLLDERYGVERELMVTALGRQRYQLTDSDREALTALIVKGSGGTPFPALSRLPFREKLASNSVQ